MMEFTTQRNEKIFSIEDDLGHARLDFNIENYSKFLISLNPAHQAVLIQGVSAITREKNAEVAVRKFLSSAKEVGLELKTP